MKTGGNVTLSREQMEAAIQLGQKYNLKRIKVGDFEADFDLEFKKSSQQQEYIAKLLSPSKEELAEEEEDLLYHSAT